MIRDELREPGRLPSPFRRLSVRAHNPFGVAGAETAARIEEVDRELDRQLAEEPPAFIRYALEYPQIYRRRTVAQVREIVPAAVRERLSAVVIVGTGGNAIHAELFQPLAPVPVIIADSPHPALLERIAALDPARTVVVYESRSGDTGEVNLLYDLFTNPASQEQGFPHSIVLASRGRLHRAALRDGVPVIELPLDIAGRYMVSTDIVGVPFHLAGLLGEDGAGLFETIARVFRAHAAALRDLAWWIPAFSFTAQQRGITNTWIAPYDRDLARAGFLANQLMNEGRGQRGCKALSHMREGPRAQHETGQRIRGGAPDHLTLFLTTRRFRSRDITVTAEGSPYAGLSGGDFVRLNAQAYANSLSILDLPHLTVEVDAVEIECLAELDALLMLWAWRECNYLGTGYDANPDVDAAKVEANRLAEELRRQRSSRA